MASPLPIGDFSRATHMSIKALRHYHRVGLLEPADVDPFTGHRRYTVEQIPTAQVIRRFRDLLGSPQDQTRAEISHRSVAAARSAAITAVIDIGDAGPWYQGALGELYATLARRT